MKTISFQPFFEAWQQVAREALHADLPPQDLIWNSAAPNDPSLELFETALPSHEAGQRSSFLEKGSSIRVPKKLLELGPIASLHSDSRKWGLLYRLLWRVTHGESKLLEIPTDADVIALNHLAKEVQKDAYRMQQYVRFRETTLQGHPWFVAWYEPQHDSVQLNEKFFGDRFTHMRWCILTPRTCMQWDGTEITYSAGVDSSAAPKGDDVESLWVTYYSNIFNPARVKVRAMKAQMPMRNWKNLPEAQVIASLLEQAPRRVEGMLARSRFQQELPSEFQLARPPQTSDWTVLRDAAATCRACPLWKHATCTVFGEGPADARVVLVGEQPGDTEDRTGKPFVGPAGKVLDRALAEAGVQRSKLYVTNAVKHFRFEPRGRRRMHQTPSDRHVISCRPWLKAELDHFKPDLIVALGATAAESLLESSVRITDHRGQILASEHGNVLITIHPSSLLRQSQGFDFEAEFARFVSELAMIRMGASGTKNKRSS